MRKQVIALAVLSGILLTACNAKNNKANNDTLDTDTTATSLNATAVTNQTLTDTLGNQLDLIFDNVKDVVTIHFKGETAELASQKPASGMWYKNERYELSGKGNNLELLKDGKQIFEHKDKIVDLKAKNDNGDVLLMTFNNSEGTAKVFLNGGEQIDLKEENAASGIWYKNDRYELSGKGDHYELKSAGKILFKN